MIMERLKLGGEEKHNTDPDGVKIEALINKQKH